jgi:hypothetical protein
MRHLLLKQHSRLPQVHVCGPTAAAVERMRLLVMEHLEGHSDVAIAAMTFAEAGSGIGLDLNVSRFAALLSLT